MNTYLQVEKKSLLHKIDWRLVTVILFLNVIGLFNLYSATHGAQTIGLKQKLFISSNMPFRGMGCFYHHYTDQL